MNGQGELAIESHRKALKLDEKYPFRIYRPYSLIAIARVHKNKKRIGQSIISFQDALKIEPHNPVLYHEIAMLKINNNSLEEGLELLKKAIHLNPDYKPSIQGLVDVYQKLGDEVSMDFFLKKLQLLEKVNEE